MNVIHSRVNKNKLNTVPVTDGQIIYVKDTHELYFDIANARTKATDIIFVATIQDRDLIQSPIPEKVYCVEEDNKFYRYDNNTWVLVGGQEQIPQVMYWDTKTDQTGIDFWNNVTEYVKTTDVLVTWYITNYGSYMRVIGKGTTIGNSIVGYLWRDNAPEHKTSYSRIGSATSTVTFTKNASGVITAVSAPDHPYTFTNYLDTDQNYNTPYVPLYDGSPANKKYVDDSIAAFTPLQSFPTGTNTTGTTQQFFSSINATQPAVGSLFLGRVNLSDMPTGLIQAEVEVEVYNNGVLYATMRSADLAPYVWYCNSYDYRGWEAQSAPAAEHTSFDNTGTDLQATNVEDAIVELLGKINDIETTIGEMDQLIDEINGE